MEKLSHFFRFKYTVLLAFLPIVNLLILLFDFVFGCFLVKKRGSVWTPVVLILGAVLYRFIPASWGWVVTYAILSAGAFLALLRLRSCEERILPADKKFIIIRIVIILALVILLFVMAGIQSTDSLVKDVTTRMLTAAEAEDSAAWVAEIHPDYVKEIGAVSLFVNELSDDGIDLESEALSVKQVGFGIQMDSDGKKTSGKFRISTGEDVFYISAVYLSDENGEGLSEFFVLGH